MKKFTQLSRDTNNQLIAPNFIFTEHHSLVEIFTTAVHCILPRNFLHSDSRCISVKYWIFVAVNIIAKTFLF